MNVVWPIQEVWEQLLFCAAAEKKKNIKNNKKKLMVKQNAITMD